MQILTRSVPPSDVVRAFEWFLPRLGVSLAIALRLVPRLEESAKWRLETLQERGFVEGDSTLSNLRTRASIWPGWLADSLDHAHDLDHLPAGQQEVDRHPGHLRGNPQLEQVRHDYVASE